jgi:predicted nucleic acid-binding protein
MIAADSGFLVALFHSRDSSNNDAKIKLQEFQNKKIPVITTAPVICELFHLLKNRENLDHVAIKGVMNNIQDFNICVVQPRNENDVFVAWSKYIELSGKKVDYTDFHLFVTGLESSCHSIVATDSIDHYQLNGAVPKLVKNQTLKLPNLLRPSYPQGNIIILYRAKAPQ